MAAALKAVGDLNRAGAVVREAIKRIGGDRTQIGDASRHARRGSPDGVSVIAIPTPVCVVPRSAARAGVLSNRTAVRAGLCPTGRRSWFTQRRRRCGRCWRGTGNPCGGAWRGRGLCGRVRECNGKRGKRNKGGDAEREGRGLGNTFGHDDLLYGRGRHGRPLRVGKTRESKDSSLARRREASGFTRAALTKTPNEIGRPEAARS
jgi:hypothetical protein